MKESTALRSWGVRLGIPVAVLLLLVVGGPFVYINFIADDAPQKLTLPPVSGQPSNPEASVTTAGRSTSLDGKWAVTGGSQAGYRVKEVLFGQDNQAVGRTGNVTGDFTLVGTTVQSGTITVDMTTIESDESRRDGQFHGRIMSTSRFPTATFTLSQPVVVPSIPADNVETAVEANGQLTLRGTTKPVVAQLEARRTGGTIQVAGSIPVRFSEWDIPNPSVAGISTQDNGLVEFLLNFAKT